MKAPPPAALVLAAFAMLAGCAAEPTNEDVFASLCEATLAKQLKAPSTLKIIETSNFDANPEQVDLDWINHRLEQLAAEDPMVFSMPRIAEQVDLENARERISAGEEIFRQPYRALITYDAANSFGTPIRSDVSCMAVTYNGALTKYDYVDIDANTTRLLMEVVLPTLQSE